MKGQKGQTSVLVIFVWVIILACVFVAVLLVAGGGAVGISTTSSEDWQAPPAEEDVCRQEYEDSVEFCEEFFADWLSWAREGCIAKAEGKMMTCYGLQE